MENTKREDKYRIDGMLTLRIGFFLFPDVSENCLEGGDVSEINYRDFFDSGVK